MQSAMSVSFIYSLVNVASYQYSVATPASSEHAEHLPEHERRHREEMEYAEPEDSEPVVEHVVEANAAIPNIPVPKSSDGNASIYYVSDGLP